MADASTLHGPALTLPETELALVRETYARASAILEYGAGGSTVLAGEVDGADVFAVESDADWLAALGRWFEANPPKARLRLHHADIGPTGKWGAPRGSRAWRRFHTYPLGVWDRNDFVPPDVVLIDGRFRTGCFLATLFRTARPVTVLIDDYAGRPAYHAVERYARPVEMAGRMARFELDPMPVPGGDLAWIIAEFARRQ